MTARDPWACVCGAGLRRAPSLGLQEHGGVECEFRTCRECRSTRAIMPAVIVAGRWVHVHRDPNTSEVDAEHASFLDALEEGATEGAAIVRSGHELARAVRLADGTWGWRVTDAPAVELPAVSVSPQFLTAIGVPGLLAGAPIPAELRDDDGERS